MLIVIYFICFLILSATFGIAKSSWNEKKYLKVVLCVILLVVEFFGFALIKEMWKKEVRESVMEEYSQEKNLIGEKTLGNLAADAPHPKIYVSGMNYIDFEDFHIKFDTAFKLPPENNNFVLGEWMDSSEENDFKITLLSSNKGDSKYSFATMTETQRKTFMKQMTNSFVAGYEQQTGGKITILDDGFFKVNGYVVLWAYAIVKQNDVMEHNAFYYFVANNKKVYMLSYFTVNSINNKPNDIILTSLNSLEFR